jgi:hypothetical protein
VFNKRVTSGNTSGMTEETLVCRFKLTNENPVWFRSKQPNLQWISG